MQGDCRLAVLAVLLNWLTTGDHLLKTVGTTLTGPLQAWIYSALGGLAGVGIARKLNQRTAATRSAPIKTSHA
jgi:hypothetical protein